METQNQLSEAIRRYYGKQGEIHSALENIAGRDAALLSRSLVPNNFGVGPFILRLPFSLTPEQIGKLTASGYEPLSLEKNEALALFTCSIGRFRGAQKLQKDEKYLDKRIADFMAREAGNHGKMYFLGPSSDYEKEIEMILSPPAVKLHSVPSPYSGLFVNREVFNLIGQVPEGATLYRKDATIFIAPPAGK
jgi:hypothetical protein